MQQQKLPMFTDRLIYFDTSAQQYNSFQKINIPEFCIGLAVKNTGNTICQFDDEPLFPGESKIYQSDEGSILVGRHSVQFSLVAVGFTPPAIPVNQAWITVAFYVNTPPGSKTIVP